MNNKNKNKKKIFIFLFKLLKFFILAKIIIKLDNVIKKKLIFQGPEPK